MEERWLLDSLKAGGSRPIFNQLSQDISFNICLNWTDNYRKKCKILWKAGLCELTRISETTCDLTQGSTSLQHPHSLLEGILREGEQMLPQIKLIQAVDRVFPELSGQQKYGSSKKKKKRKKERVQRNLLAQKRLHWKEGTQEACVYAGLPTSPRQRSSILGCFRHQAPWRTWMTATC